MIHVDSHQYVASDQEQVTQTVRLTVSPKKQRRVVSQPVLHGDLNPGQLGRTARECTGPVLTPVRPTSPQEVQVMVQIARKSRCRRTWERSKAWKCLMAENVAAATQGDWSAFRETTRETVARGRSLVLFVPRRLEVTHIWLFASIFSRPTGARAKLGEALRARNRATGRNHSSIITLLRPGSKVGKGPNNNQQTTLEVVNCLQPRS